jgi:hypothetical protein
MVAGSFCSLSMDPRSRTWSWSSWQAGYTRVLGIPGSSVIIFRFWVYTSGPCIPGARLYPSRLTSGLVAVEGLDTLVAAKFPMIVRREPSPLGIERPAVFKDAYYLCLSPLPPAGPGEGPDCHFLKEISGFGPIPARIRGVIYLLFSFWP